jgi:hypothetical protein
MIHSVNGFKPIAQVSFLRYNVSMFAIIRRKSAVLLLVFLFPVISLNADSFLNSYQWSGMGSLFLLASNNGPTADPPAILPSVGFSASWRITDLPLRIEPTIDIYFTNYEYNTVYNYPMACGPENRSAFVIGLVTAVQLTGYFPIGKYRDIFLRVYGGPAADFRIVTLAFGLHPNDLTGPIENNAQLQTNAIFEYFWGSGRWFMPVFGTGMDFPLNEHFLLGFDLRTWFPVYKLWNNDRTPAIDGWRFGVGLRITPR